MESHRRWLACLVFTLFLIPLSEVRADHNRHAFYQLGGAASRVRDSAAHYERAVCSCHHLRAEQVFAALAVKRAERLVESLQCGAPWGRVWGDYAGLQAQLRVIERRVELMSRRGEFDPAVARAWGRLHCDWHVLDRDMEAVHRGGGWTAIRPAPVPRYGRWTP